MTKFYDELPIMKDIAFSHRKRAGVSIGVYKHNGDILIAGSFLSPGDQFSRRAARKVIAARMQEVVNGGQPRFVMGLRNLSHLPVSLMANVIRQRFKPDPDEVDHLFFNVIQFEGVDMRQRVDHVTAWQIVYNIVKEMAATGVFNASVGV